MFLIGAMDWLTEVHLVAEQAQLRGCCIVHGCLLSRSGAVMPLHHTAGKMRPADITLSLTYQAIKQAPIMCIVPAAGQTALASCTSEQV